MAYKKYLDSNGKKLYEVHVKVRDRNGKQINRKKRGITSEAKAKRVEFELKMELLDIKNGAVIPYWEDWVNTCIDKIKLQYRTSTVLNYKSILRKRVTPYFNGLRIDKIKMSDVHDVIFIKQNKLSDDSRKSVLKYIRRIFYMAVEEGILAHNPAVGIKVKVAEKQKETLNHSEIELLLNMAHFHNHYYYSVWSLALLTGMRSGELYALLWTDVDFENKLIYVNKSWSKLNGTGPTKSSKNRQIPISKELESFLKGLKLRSSSEYVLPRLKCWEKGDAAKILRDFCRKIGVTPVGFHDLRATFITQLLINNVSLVKVMYIVGHARMQTTQKYLGQLGKEVKGVTESLNIELPNLRLEGGKKLVSLSGLR